MCFFRRTSDSETLSSKGRPENPQNPFPIGPSEPFAL